MPRRIVTTTAALATAVALGLVLAPAVAAPALAASDPALFSFTKGFGERPFTGATITVSGTADPASGSLQIVRSDGYDGCSADVNPATGAFSCQLEAGPSTATLTLSAQHADDPKALGTAKVRVLQPPTLDGLDGESGSPTIFSDAPYSQIEGLGIPSAEGTTTTVRGLISPADGDALPTAAGDVACTAVTDIDGNFDCEPASALLAGTYDLSVTQEPSWALGTRSLPAYDGVTLIVRGPEFVIDGKTTYTLNQGDSLTMSGTLDYDGADRDPSTAITAMMSINGTKTTPFECGLNIETIRWTCELAAAPAAAGKYTVELAATSERGLIARDRSTTVTVIGAPPVEEPPTQAPTPEPVAGGTAGVDGRARRGSRRSTPAG